MIFFFGAYVAEANSVENLRVVLKAGTWLRPAIIHFNLFYMKKENQNKRKGATRIPVYDEDGRIVDWQITRAEVMKLTGYSDTTIWRYTKSGFLPVVTKISRFKYSENMVRRMVYGMTLEYNSADEGGQSNV